MSFEELRIIPPLERQGEPHCSATLSIGADQVDEMCCVVLHTQRKLVIPKDNHSTSQACGAHQKTIMDAGWCYGGWQVAKEVLSEGSLRAVRWASSSWPLQSMIGHVQFWILSWSWLERNANRTAMKQQLDWILSWRWVERNANRTPAKQQFDCRWNRRATLQ